MIKIDDIKCFKIIRFVRVSTEDQAREGFGLPEQTNEEYKKIQTLSVTLNNVDTEIKENHDKIKTLTENNEAFTLRVETLAKNIESKDKEIEELKEENHSLKNTRILER